MAYKASAVAGSALQLYGGSSPAGYATIRGVEGLQGPTGTKATIDVTAIDDVARQFVADLPDFGNLTFTLFWDPSDVNHQTLLTSFKTTNSSDDFKIIPADADTYASRYIYIGGEVTGWEWDMSRGAAQTARVTVKLSGAVVVSTDLATAPTYV